jgi:ketosteroid isomerase-like protein
MKSSLTVIGLLLAFTPLSFAADRDGKVLIDAEHAFAKATAERGVDGWMEFMAPNAVELSAEPLVGLDQIRAGMSKQLRLPGFKITWEPTKAEFLGKGDGGYAVGRYEVRFNGEDGKPVVERGRLSHHLAKAKRRHLESRLRHRKPRSLSELSSSQCGFLLARKH